MFIDKELQEISADVTRRAEIGQSSQREIAMLLECWQLYCDKLEELEEKILTEGLNWDDSVTVKVDGKTIRFDNIEQVAEWITNGHQ